MEYQADTGEEQRSSAADHSKRHGKPTRATLGARFGASHLGYLCRRPVERRAAWQPIHRHDAASELLEPVP